MYSGFLMLPRFYSNSVAAAVLSVLPPQSSGSCSFQEQQRILGLFELSQEFKQQHYLAGLLLTELSAALDMESEGYGKHKMLSSCSRDVSFLYKVVIYNQVNT